MTPHLIGIVGPPGTGKSHMARSAAAVGTTAAALTDPKEQSFYAGSGCDVQLFHDFDWRPHRKSIQATGFNEVLAWTEARQTDDSQFVVFDTGTELAKLAEHENLKIKGASDPGDLDYGRGYTGTDALLQQWLTEIRRLHARGKTVIVTFHARMKEMEGLGEAQKRKTMSGDTEWRFDEQMLPIVSGTNAMAQSIASPFDLWLYTKPTGFGPARKFYVTAVADQVRPAKHSVTFREKVNPAMLPNDLAKLLEVIVCSPSR